MALHTMHSTPAARAANDTTTDVPTDMKIRSLEMQLMHENLARAQYPYRTEEVRDELRTMRFVAARRAERRAERAGVRARRLMLLAVAR